jgi:hypothetical protein
MERGRFHQNRFPIPKRLITAEKFLSLEETRSKSLKPAQYFFAVITAQRTPNGIYFFDPKILCATATAPGQATLSCFDLYQPLPAGYTLNSVRAASPLGQAPFPGQVFFFNQAGSTGNIQRNAINGTPYLNWDAGLSRNFRIGETQRLQIRVEAFNVLNRQVPFFGTSTAYTSSRLDVNSNNFGRITQSYNDPRIIQFGVRYDF